MKPIRPAPPGRVHGLETLAGAAVQALSEQRHEQAAEVFALAHAAAAAWQGFDVEAVFPVEQARHDQVAQPGEFPFRLHPQDLGAKDHATTLAGRLDTAGLPDPDLVLRTSGETRTSNFLPWQAAYSEYEFTPTLRPDFTPDHLAAILDRYGLRDRRNGGA